MKAKRSLVVMITLLALAAFTVGCNQLGMRTDAELMAAVADGDRDALRSLHERHVAWITARLSRRCADRDIVAEAVQDTFVAVWRGAAKWERTIIITAVPAATASRIRNGR